MPPPAGPPSPPGQQAERPGHRLRRALCRQYHAEPGPYPGLPAIVADGAHHHRQPGPCRFQIEPATRSVLTGAVGSSGDVRMSDSLDRTIATTGIFTNGRFQGEHRNGLCSYTVLMNKRD